MKRKDPKRVAAGRKGGLASPMNFKLNKERARLAGIKSGEVRRAHRKERDGG